MGSTMIFQSLEEEQIKVIVDFIDGKDSCLHLSLNPQEYFYPSISVRPGDRYLPDEEDYFSFEEFQWEIEKINMLRSEKYKKIFQKKLFSSFHNYLQTVEGEAEFEFNQKKSLEHNITQRENLIF